MRLERRFAIAIAALGLTGANASATEPTALTRDEARAVVAEMLADAAARSSLLAAPATTAGWDKGFVLASPDGAYKLNVGGYTQIRWIAGVQDSGDNRNTWQSGFDLTRTRLDFRGHVVDPRLTYWLKLAFGSNGNTQLLDGFARYDLGDGFAVQVGQFKIPLWTEWVLSETRLQFVERSIVEARFSPTYSQGVQLAYAPADGPFRAYATFTDGQRALNTPLTVPDQPGEPNNTDWAATGRAELKLTGQWSDYADTTSFRDQAEPLVVLSASLHGQDGGRDALSTQDRSITRWSADVLAKLGGWSLFAAAVGNREEGPTTFEQWGALVQSGYFVTDQLEFVARFEWGDLGAESPDRANLLALTGGFNYFFAKHAAKITVDAGVALNEIAPAWRAAARGWRPDAQESGDQVVVRTQLQLMF